MSQYSCAQGTFKYTVAYYRQHGSVLLTQINIFKVKSKYMPVKGGLKLLIHYQISTETPLEFEDR